MSRPVIALWDLGNVVVRWDPEVILENFNFDAEPTAFLRHELLGHQDWLRLDQGLITEQQFAERLVSESSLSASQVQHCFDVIRESLTDIPESVELIEQMYSAGISMYVLSNMPLINAGYLRQRPYFKYFDGVVISAEEKLIKPDPALFQRVLDKHSLRAQDLYFIDDSLPNIETAKAAGMHAQHFHRTAECYRQIRQVFALDN
ncbi:MAG: HAD family phosphatase [Pseudomonadota bacterium]